MDWVNFPGGMGVRIDSAVYPGYMIPPFYDSMVAKLIVKGRDREEALAKLGRALDEFIIEGPATTIILGKKLLESDDFCSGKYNTKFLDTFMEENF